MNYVFLTRTKQNFRRLLEGSVGPAKESFFLFLKLPVGHGLLEINCSCFLSPSNSITVPNVGSCAL